MHAFLGVPKKIGSRPTQSTVFQFPSLDLLNDKYICGTINPILNMRLMIDVMLRVDKTMIHASLLVDLRPAPYFKADLRRLVEQ